MAEKRGDELTIGEAARRAGLRTSALRYYERIGLLPKSQRAQGRRIYTSLTLRRVALVQFARGAGYTIAEIDHLLHGFPAEVLPAERWRALATAKLAELEAIIAEAQRMKARVEQTMQCECDSMDACGEMGAQWAH